MKEFKPRGLATHIGSLPYTDPAEACQLVLKYLPEIPAWPQLPKRSTFENMYIQFSEGFPGLNFRDDHIYVDRSLDLTEQLEQLYKDYLGNEFEKYGLSSDYAAGFNSFLSQKLDQAIAVKGQVTGPISFGLVVTDQNRRPIVYDDTLAEALARYLRLKAIWQENALSRLSSNTIIFIDEPYLASVGSAFVSLPSDKITRLLEEVLGGIKGLKGIHCCGNTDWPLLLNTSIDILNIDAYTYGDSLIAYPAQVKAFLERGGVIAWGIVPNDEQVLPQENVTNLMGHLRELMGSLLSKGISYDILIEQSMITPSCGLGTLSTQGALRVLELTAEVSKRVRKEF